MSFFEDQLTLRRNFGFRDQDEEHFFESNATESYNQDQMSSELYDFQDENLNFEGQPYSSIQDGAEPFVDAYSPAKTNLNQFAFNPDSDFEAYSSPTPQNFNLQRIPLEYTQQSNRSAAPLPPRNHNLSRIGIRESERRSSDSQASNSKHGIQLLPVSVLPDQYRSMFSFPVFNAVQSSVLETVLNSDQNVCVSAPTGSGKTVIFELAIIRLLKNSATDKAVYLAPTKALTSERFHEWSKKFSNLASVVELTGDTEFLGLSSARNARIIITTPEKWDSLTRRWKAHSKILDSLQLVLIDEVHVLHEASRGPRLEVVVSRMKTYGSQIRFLALSATIPNIGDIAEWIGGDQSWSGASQSAKVFSFSDAFRPCPLKKFIYGYPNSRDEFAFSASLNSKLMDLVCQHSARKPCLVFVATRKATTEAASRIAKDYAAMASEGKTLPWEKPRDLQGRFQDSKLQELAMLGIAVHHAGLSVDDRRAVEAAFKEGKIGVLCSTSTLATGVNLPAYLVIIRGTKVFTGSWTEMSDLDFFQALGRAGRPQFDREGVCVVLCDSKLKQHYSDLATGNTIIESSLHLELKEHITAEVTLSENSSMDMIQRWVKGTYLWVRIAKNPSHYKLDGIDTSSSPEALLRSICENAVDKLKEHKFLDASGSSGSSPIISTELGDILSKYFLRYGTMLRLAEVKPNSSIRDLIALLSEAEEFDDIRMRQGEKAAYNKARTHHEIRFPPLKIVDRKDKISLLLQIVLAGIPFSEALNTKDIPVNPGSDAVTIFRHSSRILKATMDVALLERDGGTTKAAFELLRSANGKAWDASPIVLRQIEGIGEKSIKVLAAAGLSTLEKVAQSNPRRIEMLLSRNTPFGNKVVASAQSFPSFTLSVEQIGVKKLEDSVEVNCSITVGLQSTENVRFRKKDTNVPYFICVLTVASDNTFFDYRRLPVKKLLGPGGESEDKTFTIPCHLTRPSQKISCIVGCDEISGSAIVAHLRPEIEAKLYPQPRIQSQASMQIEEEEKLLEGLGDELFDDDILLTPPRPPSPTKKKAAPKKPAPPSKAASTSASASSLRVIPSPPPLYPSRLEEPVKLPNGKYRCNHSCKDKQACRHLCCREGMPKPPKPLSKTAMAKRATSDQEANPLLKRLDNLTRKDDASKTSKENGSIKKKKQAPHSNQSIQIEDSFSDLDDVEIEDSGHEKQSGNGTAVKKREGSAKLYLPTQPKKVKTTNRTLLTDIGVTDSDDEMFDSDIDSDDELLAKAENPLETLKKFASSNPPLPQPELSEEEDQLNSDQDELSPLLSSRSISRSKSDAKARVGSSSSSIGNLDSPQGELGLGVKSAPKDLITLIHNPNRERKRETDFLSRIGAPKFKEASSSSTSTAATSKPTEPWKSKSSNPRSTSQSALFLKSQSEDSSSVQNENGSSGTTVEVEESRAVGREGETLEKQEEDAIKKPDMQDDIMYELDEWAKENIEVEDD